MVTLKPVLDFLNKSTIPEANDVVFYCETRDQASLRLSKWVRTLESMGLSARDSILLVSMIGELANNSFDHNLGHWKDLPGCIVSFERIGNKLFILVGDQGQGIAASLSHALPQNTPASEVLRKAFEERVSGRAPERRGNGLKYVLKHIQDGKHSLFCFTQGLTYHSNAICVIQINSDSLPKNFSTLIGLEWRIK